MRIKLSNKQWQWMGMQAGWLKEAAKLEEGGPDMRDVFGDPETQEDSKGNIAPFAPVLGESEKAFEWLSSLDNGSLHRYIASELKNIIIETVGNEPTMKEAIKILSKYPSLLFLTINWGIGIAMSDAGRANRIALKKGNALLYPNWNYDEIVKSMPSAGLGSRMEGDTSVLDKVISRLPAGTNRNEMVDLIDGLIEGTKEATETFLERVGGEGNQDTTYL
jgi:hypothetical protein